MSGESEPERSVAAGVDPDRLHHWHRAVFAMSLEAIRRSPGLGDSITDRLRVITRWVDAGSTPASPETLHEVSALYELLRATGLRPPDGPPRNVRGNNGR